MNPVHHIITMRQKLAEFLQAFHPVFYLVLNGKSINQL
jgi:hypothetical protein